MTAIIHSAENDSCGKSNKIVTFLILILHCHNNDSVESLHSNCGSSLMRETSNEGFKDSDDNIAVIGFP